MVGDYNIIRYFHANPSMFDRFLELGQNNYKVEFSDPFCQLLWDWWAIYFQRYRKLPVWSWVEWAVREHPALGDRKEDYLETLQEIVDDDTELNYDHVYYYFQGLERTRLAEQLTMSWVDTDVIPIWEKAVEFLKCIRHPERMVQSKQYDQWIQPFAPDMVANAWDNLCELKGSTITSGFPEWDFLLGGGGKRGGLTIIHALPKRGKSLFLSNYALAPLRANDFDRVVVFVCDNITKEALAKLYAIVSRTSIGYDPNLTKEILLDRLQKQVHSSWGDRLWVIRWPRKRKTPDDVRRALRELREQLYVIDKAAGLPEHLCGHIDRVVVDYADVLKGYSIKGRAAENKRHDVDDVFVELAAIAEEGVGGPKEEFEMVTATQSNRLGLNSDIVDESTVGEAFSKLHHCDLFASITLKKQDRIDGTMRLYVSSGRREFTDYIVNFYMDVARQTLSFNPERGITNLDGSIYEPWAKYYPDLAAKARGDKESETFASPKEATPKRKRDNPGADKLAERQARRRDPAVAYT